MSFTVSLLNLSPKCVELFCSASFQWYRDWINYYGEISVEAIAARSISSCSGVCYSQYPIHNFDSDWIYTRCRRFLWIYGITCIMAGAISHCEAILLHLFSGLTSPTLSSYHSHSCLRSVGSKIPRRAHPDGGVHCLHLYYDDPGGLCRH
jgi:hypothetical protein